jgi:hypothetical protein
VSGVLRVATVDRSAGGRARRRAACNLVEGAAWAGDTSELSR